MADAQDKKGAEKEAGENTKSGGSSKMLFIVIGVVLLLAVCVGAAFALGLFSGEEATASTQAAGPAATAKTGTAPGEIGPVAALPSFVVNLADAEQDRYLKVTVELELANEEIKASCDKKMARIKDALISLFSSKSFDQIRDIKGKIKLRQEIVIRTNEVLGAGSVNHVYFTEFMVQ